MTWRDHLEDQKGVASLSARQSHRGDGRYFEISMCRSHRLRVAEMHQSLSFISEKGSMPIIKIKDSFLPSLPLESTVACVVRRTRRRSRSTECRLSRKCEERTILFMIAQLFASSFLATSRYCGRTPDSSTLDMMGDEVELEPGILRR